MRFNTSWSEPVIFTGGEDSTRRVKKFWNCKGKRGIYVFSDEWDSEILYIGKADDINDRVGTHLRGDGNQEIFNLISNGGTVRIRWAESKDPFLSESIAIIQLAPKFNNASQWNIDRHNVDLILDEAERLGLIPTGTRYWENVAVNLCEALGLRVFEYRRKKEQLCCQAESLSNSTDWKATAEAIKVLQAEWKTIGSSGKSSDDELWNRFRGAIDKFYERRKQHFEKRDREQEENRNRKEKICREAESLSYSKDWKLAHETFKQLTDQWKKLGFAGKDYEEELWQRFRNAKNKFYERQSELYKQNLQQKERLCTIAQSLTYDSVMTAFYPTGSWGSGDVKNAIKRVKELQAEWKTIGPVPRDEVDRVEKCFRNACDRVFKWAKEERERKQAEWRNKMQETLARKREQAERLRESISHDESVLARKNESYWNVRPGRRADEIRESIRNQISALEDKIHSKRKRLDDLEASIRDIQSKLW
jgi:hypothetical protein